MVVCLPCKTQHGPECLIPLTLTHIDISWLQCLITMHCTFKRFICLITQNVLERLRDEFSPDSITPQPKLLSELCCYIKVMHTFWPIRFMHLTAEQSATEAHWRKEISCRRRTSCLQPQFKIRSTHEISRYLVSGAAVFSSHLMSNNIISVWNSNSISVAELLRELNKNFRIENSTKVENQVLLEPNLSISTHGRHRYRLGPPDMILS